MFKKCIKLLFILTIMWLVTLLTIVTEYRRGNFVLIKDRDFYEKAMRRFKNKYDHKNISFNISSFEVWQLLEPTNVSMSVDDMMIAVKSYDIPPGVNGKPVILNPDIKMSLRLLIKTGWKEHEFNQFVSDLIPLNRSLLDVRDDWCKHQNYSNKLPQATVVICFHNEAWSTLIRTVYSVINRSPKHLLKQIILFDDYSNMAHLKKPLEDFIRNLSNVVLKRAMHREGLIRARIQALKYVTTPVVVYLDSHCECTNGWLEPLLERVAEDPTRVVSPIVDDIHDSTFEYIAQETNELLVGGFNWHLEFKWRPIPHDTLIKRKIPSAPVQTPTISGGLFAINKDYFAKLGHYDDGFDIWGAENLELSFKVWMCGGTLEIVPCSHVGHVFRKKFPYSVGHKGYLKRNTVRLAKVWMDDYAKYYYDTIGNEQIDYGNISKRLDLRAKLKCQSFQWYLENIYPQLDLPDNYVAKGQIYSLSTYAGCLDSTTSDSMIGIAILPCHHQGGHQFWVYTKNGEIKRDELCLDYLFQSLVLYLCKGHSSSQIWLYDAKTKHIRHMDTQKCIQVVKYPDGLKLILENCSTSSKQTWVMENYAEEKLSTKLLIYAHRQ